MANNPASGKPMVSSTLDSIFYVLAGLGLLGVMLTLLVPMARAQIARRPARAEPTPASVVSLQRAA